jgi:ferric-dicitrate binding protein FerR (iron transport regulator)
MTLLPANKLFVALVALAAVSASPVCAAVEIGNTKVVVRTVTGTLGETVRTLVVQDRVSQNEIIATKADSASQIVFEDSTTLTLGPNAQVTLDKFVYDPNPTKAAFFLTLGQGIMRFITGTLDHSAYTIKTPNGTIGVRGTILYAAVNCSGKDCSTGVGSIQGDVIFTDKDGKRTIIHSGQFKNFGSGSSGDSDGGGGAKDGVMAALAYALDLVGFGAGADGAGGGFGGPAAAGGAGFNAPQSPMSPTTLPP